MPPADTLLSLLQLANYLHARGQVMVGVPCFGGPHGRRQRTGRTGPPKHATRGYFSFSLAGSYLVTAPNLGFWTKDGFGVENEGVPPDVEVEQWPADVLAGHEPQLEKAME